jgi:hypothetical protein
MASVSTASAIPARSINPMIALSIFGSQASAAAICGSAAAAAAGAAVTAQAPAGGCVLPLVDAPPPPPIVEAPPFVPAPVSGGFGISPILLGLAGIAILAALIASQDDDDDDGSPPISVN